MRLPVEIPSIESLPQAVCSTCSKSKIRGLFTPAELLRESPRCRLCVGEISEKQRLRKKEGW